MNKISIYFVGLLIMFGQLSADDVLSINTNNDKVKAIAISPDGNNVALGGENKYILIRNAKDGKELLEYAEHNDTVNDIQYSQDGKMIGSVSDDGVLNLWNSSTGENIFSYKNSIVISEEKNVNIGGHVNFSFGKNNSNNGINSLSFSADGKYVAFGSENGSINIIDIVSKQVTTIGAHKDEITKLIFGKDDKSLYSSSEDGTIKEWNIENKKATYTFRDNKNAVKSIAMSLDKNTLVSIGKENEVIVYNLLDKSIIHQEDEDAETVVFLGNNAFALGIDRKIIVLDKEKFKKLDSFKEHKDDILKLVYSNEGKILVSSSDDATVKIRKVDFK